MSLKYVALTLGIFLLGFSASLNSADQGFIEGHLKIIFGMAAQPPDDMPRPEIAPESYAEYPLVVLAPGEQQRNRARHSRPTGKLSGPAAAGELCSRRSSSYAQACSDQATTLFVSNQIVHVDMNVVIGLGFH